MKTTRELARAENYKKLVQNLQELLVKNYDSDKGYRKAMKEVKSADFKEHFKRESLRHKRFANELDKLLHSLNATPLEEGSKVGRFHRIWMDIILGITGNEDHTTLEECRRGQKAGIKEYEEKLGKNKFPPQIEEVLKRHLQELKEAPVPKDSGKKVAC